MLDTPLLWQVATRIPSLFNGRALHRAALHAMASGAYDAADVLFERAAEHYRLDLQVESLARLRVHQLIGRVRASGDADRDTAVCLDVEQRLTRLATIESLVAPFELVPASNLLAGWARASQPGTDGADRSTQASTLSNAA
jgi:hypothetical protein